MRPPAQVMILALAAAVTLLNAFKPAVVDDAAYLRMAEQIASNPLDPYGFEQFWYKRPQPAMEVLAPPVVPYLLALGLAIGGGSLFAAKLALFPVVWLLAFSTWRLLRRFAPGQERVGTVMVLGSPFVLPMLNAMLDVPVLAFAVASVEAFLSSWRLPTRPALLRAALAGVLLALAFQAKYNALTIPVVVAVAVAVHRGRRPQLMRVLASRPMLLAIVMGVVATTLVLAWELWLVQKYDVSHFSLQYELSTRLPPISWDKRVKFNEDMVSGHIEYLGYFAFATGLAGARALGFSPRMLASLTAAFVACVLVIVFGPLDAVVPRTPEPMPRVRLAEWAFGVGGSLVLLTTLLVAVALSVRGWRVRVGPKTLFMIAWLAVEAVASQKLSPFPAGRRVIVFSFVLSLLTLRGVAAFSRLDRKRRVPGWVVGTGLALGLGLAALDHYDARAEPELARRSRDVVPARPGVTVWTQGVWGWQYSTRKLGYELVVPGKSVLSPGDYLVLPVSPGPVFWRPNVVPLRYPPGVLEPVATLSCDDGWRYTTLPTLYGGYEPILGRDYPRLTVVVYRVRREVVPELATSVP